MNICISIYLIITVLSSGIWWYIWIPEAIRDFKVFARSTYPLSIIIRRLFENLGIFILGSIITFLWPIFFIAILVVIGHSLYHSYANNKRG